MSQTEKRKRKKKNVYKNAAKCVYSLLATILMININIKDEKQKKRYDPSNLFLKSYKYDKSKIKKKKQMIKIYLTCHY